MLEVGSKMVEKQEKTFLLLMVAILVPLYLVGVHPHLGLWGDNAAYLILSRAI